MKTSSIVKSALCILLAFAMVLPLCSCGFDFDSAKKKGKDLWNDAKEKGGDILSDAQDLFGKAKDKIVEMYGTAKDGVVYVYSEAADWTVEGYNKASAKATELIGDAKEYIAGLNKPETYEITYAQADPQYPIRDLAANQSFNEKDAIVIDKNYLTEQFVTYYISSVLGARGYTVYNGAVYYKENVYGGLIFTKGDVFIEEDGKKIYSCGFVQLVPDNYSGLIITDKMVQSGLIAVSTSSYGSEVQSFIVDEYATFDDFSGVFNNVYFKYTQVDHYVVSVSLKENIKGNYDPQTELYDFDNEKIIYSSEDASKEVKELFVKDPDSFQGASATVNAVVDVEDNNEGDLSTVFVLDGGTLDKISEKAAGGASKVTSFLQSGLNKLSLNGSQFLSVDKDGKAHILGSENAVDESRVTNGLISTIGSGLAATGAVASIVCVCKGGVIVVSAIVITTGASAIVYNVANMLSGAQDIYYGAKGSVDESKNPVLALFKKMIPDEKTATLVYHIWGVANTVLSNIMMPVSKALNIAKVKGLNAFQTAGNVIRASVTTVAKALATGIGAGVVANYVGKVVAKVSNDENLGKLAGFGACLVTGMLIYKGLDSIDKKLDISGLYPKSDVKASFIKNQQEQSKQLYKNNVSRKQRGEDEELVKDLSDKAADLFGIEEKPTIKIVYDSGSADSGSYSAYDNTLTVNMRSSNNVDWDDVAVTIGHEMKHAQQYQNILNGINDEITYSYKHYIFPPDCDYITTESEWFQYQEYANQPCEVDAEMAGKAFLDFIIGSAAG